MRCKAFLRVVACLVASLPVSMSPISPSAFAADDVRVSGPIVHDNLAIYLLHGSAALGVVPLTLQEALTKGRVKVEETGSVNALTVENVGNDEVFVQAGDIVKGGRQDRVLSVDLLLPPRSGRVSIAAFCIEQARWSARGYEDARQFSSASSAMPSQEAKLAMRALAGAAPTPLAADPTSGSVSPPDYGRRQQQMWKTVTATQERLAHAVGAPVISPASPSSLQLSLESEKLKQAQAAYITALVDGGEADADIVGYVFAINGKINGGDVYASHELFRKMWRKQLVANVTEAIGKKDPAGTTPPPIKDVEAFLAAANGGVQSEHAIDANVRLATLERDTLLYAETRRSDGTWVHRNYLAK